MNVVDPYDTNTPQDPADTSSGLAQLEYFPAHPYSHPDFDSFGDHDGLAFFSDGTVSYWGEDVGVGKTSLMGHDHPLGLGDPGTELDLPLSDHSYPASSSASTGSPASTNVVYPPGYTPDDGNWQQRHQRDGPGDLLPPLQLAYPVMSMNTPRTSSPHRRALNMPYHELSPRATPMMPGSSSSYFTPKASGAVRAYPLVFSHTDIESPSHHEHQHPHSHMQHQQQQSPGQYQHRCVPLSELTAAYIPSTVSRNGAVEPLRTSSLGALSVQSEGVQPARLVTQPQQHHQLLKRPHSPYSPSLPSTPSDESFGFPSPKRARVTSMRLPEPRADGYSDAEGESEAEFDDEDAYLPSRSPSPAFSGSNYSDSGSPVRNYRSRNTRRAKGKVAAMMSAADALRYAQQASCGSASRSASNGYESDVVAEVKPRKNQAIPIPIPIPHLTKKSRGRKVPYVDAQVSRIRSRGGSDDEEVEIRPVRGTTSRRGRGGRSGGGRSGERSFVCSVPGCGKCFVRGEHLKRHVRSIHTHEKPYPCPYDGCQKSFSRRDNLGQHVRLHLIAA